MPFSRRGVRLRRVLNFIVAAYIVAFAALPFAHHDLVCHIKSSTHCTVCHVGTSGEDSGAHSGPMQVRLAAAGQPEEAPAAPAIACAIRPFSGRAPPSSPTSPTL
ncbi:MAG: hypothetical protein ABJC89_05500 [Acidobacteriota bacterium]